MLNPRKIKILEAIINDYIITAMPVGSRTIAKRHDMGLSSATIRNEMSDLEDMGYILRGHASAGRVPSDKGYRLYVDNLMQKVALGHDERELLNNAFVQYMEDKQRRLELLMKNIAQTICQITNYTTIATSSTTEDFLITRGLKNILYFPEFADIEKARLVFNALEDDSILQILRPSPECQNIQVIIGEENEFIDLQYCSVIQARLSLPYGLGCAVHVAIIGPTRMDYSKALAVLRYVRKENHDRRSE